MINRPLRSGAPVWFLLLAHWAVTSAGPPPDDEVHGWLQRMSRAVRVLSYDGVFVYTQNEQLDVLRVVHYVDDRGETERITTLTGQPREVIRDKEQVTCILPEDRKVSVGIKANRSPFPKLFAERIAKLSGTYDFKMGGTDRVAGRSVRQLVITPKDGYRYGYQLWLDESSALPLRSEMTDNEGHVVEQIVFTSIQVLDDVQAEVAQPGGKANQVTWQASDTGLKANEHSGWTVGWLPAGFALVAHKTRRLSPQGSAVEHLLFSDGLASVSVFIEPSTAESQSVPAQVQEMGAVHAYHRRVGAFLATVVGEVPGRTVERIGQSVGHSVEQQ